MDLLKVVSRILKISRWKILRISISSIILRVKHSAPFIVIIQLLASAALAFVLADFGVGLNKISEEIVTNSGVLLTVYSVFVAVIFGAISIVQGPQVGPGMLKHIFSRTFFFALTVDLVIAACFTLAYKYSTEMASSVLFINYYVLYIAIAFSTLGLSIIQVYRLSVERNPYKILRNDIIKEGIIDAYSTAIYEASAYYFNEKYVYRYRNQHTFSTGASINSFRGGGIINVKLKVYNDIRQKRTRNHELVCYFSSIHLGQRISRNQMIASGLGLGWWDRVRLRMAPRVVPFDPFDTNARILTIAEDAKSLVLGGSYFMANSIHELVHEYMLEYTKVYSNLLPKKQWFRPQLERCALQRHSELQNVLHDVLVYEHIDARVAESDSIERMALRAYVNAMINNCTPVMRVVLGAIERLYIRSVEPEAATRHLRLIRAMMIDGVRETLSEARRESEMNVYIYIAYLKSPYKNCTM